MTLVGIPYSYTNLSSASLCWIFIKRPWQLNLASISKRMHKLIRYWILADRKEVCNHSQYYMILHKEDFSRSIRKSIFNSLRRMFWSSSLKTRLLEVRERRNGDVIWLLRSFELTTVDYFLWGFVRVKWQTAGKLVFVR